MSLLCRASLRTPCKVSLTTGLTGRHSLSSTARVLAGPPHSEGPPSAKAAGKPNHPADDKQSSAGANNPGEAHKSGDDHPAKQPDAQAESDRSTGFHEVKGGVKGGKEGLGARSDKQ